MIKKVFFKIINAISIIVILCAVGVLLTVVLTPKGNVPNILGYSFFRVMTGSMEPGIPVDSLIVVKKQEIQELEVGDVISFFSRDPSLMGEVNTHRIVEINEENGEYVFATKGDANNVADRYLTLEEDVIGKVVFSSLGLGKCIRLISNPLIFLPLIIFPMVLLLGHSLYESFTVARKLVREEEEAAVKEAIEAIRCKKENERNE